jgi:isochorismate synthase
MAIPPREGATSVSSSSELDAALTSLRARLPKLLARTVPTSRHRLLSFTLGLPALKLHGIPELSEDAVYWSQPEADQTSCGLGNAFEIVTSGPRRFAELRYQLERLPSSWLHVHVDHPPSPAHLMLAFCFGADQGDRELAKTRLHLPELLFEQRGERASITFSTTLTTGATRDRLGEQWLARAEALLKGLTHEMPAVGGVQRLHQIASLPSREGWLNRVHEARRLIQGGTFSKVVLSRRLRVRTERPIDTPRVVNWLRGRYPSCAHVAYSLPEGTLISASPERLVRLRDGLVRSDAVASTTVRSPDHAEDRYLEQELLANPKSRREHGVVVEAIVQGLRPLCRSMGIPPEPRIMKLETLQHLWTPIEGLVRPATTLLDCAERLHPTPAVGGYPREPALSWLAAQEERRGWFTGGIGWITPQGEGELAVVLRCALVKGDEAEVFAGAGIVRDSDPQAELGEIELKMRVMLDALASAGTGH